MSHSCYRGVRPFDWPSYRLGVISALERHRDYSTDPLTTERIARRAMIGEDQAELILLRMGNAGLVTQDCSFVWHMRRKLTNRLFGFPKPTCHPAAETRAG